MIDPVSRQYRTCKIQSLFSYIVDLTKDTEGQKKRLTDKKYRWVVFSRENHRIIGSKTRVCWGIGVFKNGIEYKLLYKLTLNLILDDTPGDNWEKYWSSALKDLKILSLRSFRQLLTLIPMEYISSFPKDLLMLKFKLWKGTV